MKKFLFLLVVTLFLLAVWFKYNSLPVKTIAESPKTQLRVEELKEKFNPEYVEGELKSVGKLITLKSAYKYTDTIEEKGVLDLTLRQIVLELEFEYGLGMDLQFVTVNHIIDKTIVVNIPKDKIQLFYLQLDHEKSKVINGKKMIFVNQFQPNEVEMILQHTHKQVLDKIVNDRKAYNQAMESLKDDLLSIIYKLGYTNIIFQEV